MAPYCWPDEVDVFSVPHSRMKTLVDTYKNMIISTDFSNVHHLQILLESLKNVFSEFKAHEHIENSLIMKRLKIKLRAASVTSAAVCNCHSDNRLSDMLHLVLDGYKLTQKTKTERQSYGDRLKMALEDFTKKFLPHMEEEEKVFQPMLMQYFSYDELKELKAKVIEQHLKSEAQEEGQSEKFVVDDSETESGEENVSEKDHFSNLPNEICQKIFSFLGPKDLVKMVMVSKRWKHLSRDPILWSHVYPVHWAQGKWSFTPEPLGGVDGPGEDRAIRNVCNIESYSFIDEDADLDDSEDSEGADTEEAEGFKQILSEAKILTGIVKYLLPTVGEGVKVFDLAYSKGLSNSLVHKVLKLCPNLELLDLTHTRVGDDAFKEFGTSDRVLKLRHLDLTGCDNITDLTLLNLAKKVFLESASHLEIENLPLHCPFRQTSCCQKLFTPKTKENSDAVCSKTCNFNEDKNVLCNTNSCDLSYVYLDMLIESDGNLQQPCLSSLTEICGDQKECNLLTLETKYNECSCPLQPVPASCHMLCANSSDNSDIIQGLCSLEYLSLNGCYRISDTGLCALAIGHGLPNLTHLDVSGCIALSGYGLSRLVSTCTKLDHANLYYCANMRDDPYRTTASGCRNVECESRFCCSIGQ